MNLHNFFPLDGVKIKEPPYEAAQPHGLFMKEPGELCLFLPMRKRTASLVLGATEQPVQSSDVDGRGGRYSLMSLVLTQEGNLGQFDQDGSFFCHFPQVRHWLDKNYQQIVSSQSRRELDPLSEDIVTADLSNIQNSVLRVWISRIQNFLLRGRLPFYLSKTRDSFHFLSEYNDLVHVIDKVSDFIRDYQRYYEALFCMMDSINSARTDDGAFSSKSKDEVNKIMSDFFLEVDELKYTAEILVYLHKFRVDVRRVSRVLASDLRDSILWSSFEHTKQSFFSQLHTLFCEFNDVFSDPELQHYLTRDFPFKIPIIPASLSSSEFSKK